MKRRHASRPSPYARIPRGQRWHEMLAAYRAGVPTLGVWPQPIISVKHGVRK